MLLIKVSTQEGEGEGEGKPHQKIIDHDDKGDRAWLGRHCFWAMRNNCTVTTQPVEILVKKDCDA